jgi:prophage regulatory protein|tara:strand:- start:523 stop:735 length:213 start_codon:yes stop_codon:yes gene_type:complete
MSTPRTTPELIVAGEIAQRIPYSQNQLRRLEAQGSFPKRVRIGANRVAWVREEIDDWLQGRISQRDGGRI